MGTGSWLRPASGEIGGDDLLVGSVVDGRYHVAGILGQGTAGTVFGVEQMQLGRRAAMKVLRPRYGDADVVHRVFHGDARAAWSVVHPCLCEVLDLGTLPDGAPYFVMEYLEGETLAKQMRRERLSLAAAASVMMQLLSAIEAIHVRALLVRELHPQNVFLSHRGGCPPVVKILDFGLARLTPLEKIEEQWGPSGPGSLAHPFYLSPERTRGEHAIEPASDLFVAAVVFYEMLTGQRPFASTDYKSLVSDIARASVRPLTEVRAEIPPALDAFVRRALAADPRARPRSAAAMQEELRRIFDDFRRTGAPPPTPQAPRDVYAEETETKRTVDVANIHDDVPTARMLAAEAHHADAEGEETETMELPAGLREELERMADTPLMPRRGKPGG